MSINDDYGISINQLKKNDCKRMNVDFIVYLDKSTNQIFATTVDSPIVFTDVDTLDSENWHSPSVNPEKINCPKDGYYNILVNLEFSGITTDCSLYIQSGDLHHYMPLFIAAGMDSNISFEVNRRLQKGDSFQFNVKQSGVVAGITLIRASVMIIRLADSVSIVGTPTP